MLRPQLFASGISIMDSRLRGSQRGCGNLGFAPLVLRSGLGGLYAGVRHERGHIARVFELGDFGH